MEQTLEIELSPTPWFRFGFQSWKGGSLGVAWSLRQPNWEIETENQNGERRKAQAENPGGHLTLRVSLRIPPFFRFKQE